MKQGEGIYGGWFAFLPKMKTFLLETIWPDAYPDNDPHKVATWKAAYELKLTTSK